MNDTAPAKATAREWIGLAVLALPCMLYSMDLTVLHLAIPAITRELAPSATQLLWIIDVYGFLVAGSLVTMGTLGDRIGRRRLLLIGAAAFGVASVLAAFSTSPEMLIATRALLGVAGATIAPSTMSLLRNMFRDPGQFMTGIGVVISAYSAGAAVGPLVGGVLLEYFWWGSVFLAGVPVMVLLLVVGPVLLPEYRDPNAGRPDLPSAALSLVTVLVAIFGLKQIAVEGIGPLSALAIGIAVGAGALFVRRQRTLADPFIDLRLFANREFNASLGIYVIALLAIFGAFLFIPQYLQLVRDLSPLQAGLWTLGWPLAFVVGSNVTPKLAQRIRPAYLMAGGMVMAGVGNLALAALDASTSLPVLVVGTVVVGLGLSPMFTLANNFIMSSAPPDRAGAAAAIAETSAELGVALGIAVIGSLGTAVYRGHLTSALPAGLSPEAGAAARETLAGAVEVAAHLPGQLGFAVLEAAQTAFVQGLQLAAVIGAVASIVLAVFTLATLRNVQSDAAHG
jgi:DHA2 family multidrug resistance protein-like MFS transporter